MDIFVWYSKGTKESGVILGENMREVSHGTVPPKDFKGVAVCLGAKPADVFKWESRNFRALMNDPRKVSELTANKVDLFNKVDAVLGAATLKRCPLNELSSFDVVEQTVGGSGFYCCTERLTGATLVSNQNELQNAFNKGLTMAVNCDFKSKEVNRVYVVNGKAVVTLTKSFEADKVLKNMAKGDNGKVCEETYQRLFKWHKDGRINIAEHEHVVEEKVGDAGATRTINPVMGAINNRAQLYCIEYIKPKVGSPKVTNIIFAPSIEGLSEGAIALLSTQVQEWAKTNSKSFKESLLKLINDTTEEEAEVMLGAINKYANG